MAASSPAPSINSTDTVTTNGGTPPRRSSIIDAHNPPPNKPNLRGLNKPKCSQCGNVARSRCPYQSCKSCCSKAQNPCHIHVLKSNASLPDKQPPSSSLLVDQKSTEVPSTGGSARFSSLRQLSNNFAQFNGAHIPLRSRKPLSRKEAAAINAWRFSKLKEYTERNIEAENEAFDRYMQNVSLLEETFCINSSLEGLKKDGLPIPDGASAGEDESQKMISVIKAKLKSNSEIASSFRQRIQDCVERELKKLQKGGIKDDGVSGDSDDLNGQRESKRQKKVRNWQAKRNAAVNDLIDKLNRARNEDELKSCLDMKIQLFSHNVAADQLTSRKEDSIDNKNVQTSDKKNVEDISILKLESDSTPLSPYSLPRLFSTIEVNQETLSDIYMQFSSLDQIAEL